ncbi:MAG: metal-dependent hydrolase [Gammaproteobacteria bacterium]|nr:metal-dependent hydrolase [Gammaproteobacteria bacterium]
MNTAVMPIRRDISFNLPADKVTNWHKTGLHVSQFFNSMSLFFPVGERFFIDSVRAFRDQVSDPELKQAMTAFIGQEAMHGREHDELNDLLHAAGVPVKAQEAFVTTLLKFIQESSPAKFQLAVTVALEHLTAIMGNALLSKPETMEGSDERFMALWNWHAIEETEHKAVCFDVYEKVMGKTLGSYALRTSTLVLATGIFFALLYPFYVENVRRKGGLFNLRGWRDSFRYQWGSVGTLRSAVGEWFDWFKPGFHPWDHDNRHFLSRIDEYLAKVEVKQDKRAAKKVAAA